MIPEPLTKVGHALFGFLMALAVTIHPVTTIVGTVLFVMYEIGEDYHLHDEFYEEIAEFLYGFSLGVTSLLIAKFIIGVL